MENNVHAEGNNDDYEQDSDLENEYDIDEAGNVIKDQISRIGFDSGNLGHILAGYGTDVCNQIIEEFVNIQINHKNLSSLNDKDLQLLGIKNPEVRKEMLEEFSQMINQDPHYMKVRAATNINQYNDVVLTNVYKHLSNLRKSLSAVLLNLYARPAENILINQNTYASTLVLKTLDEFNRNINIMEKKLLELQYGKDMVPVPKKRSLWRLLTILGMFSLGSALFFRYLKPTFLHR